MSIKVSEGFRNSWKPRNVGEYIDNYPGTHALTAWLSASNAYTYNGTGIIDNLGNTSQNIPDVLYFTQGGFGSSAFGGEHGISAAGTADFGTRIAIPISAPPTGATLKIPTTVPISNGAGKRGMVEFITSSAGPVSVVGLRAKADGTLTTIPVLVK